MQVRREASSCDSASELLKTLTIHEEWDALGEQIYEELCAVSKGDADKSLYYSPATGWMLEDMCSDLAVYRREAAATQIQACWRGADGRAKATFVRAELRQCRFSFKQFYDAHEWEVREHGHERSHVACARDHTRHAPALVAEDASAESVSTTYRTRLRVRDVVRA